MVPEKAFLAYRTFCFSCFQFAHIICGPVIVAKVLHAGAHGKSRDIVATAYPELARHLLNANASRSVPNYFEGGSAHTMAVSYLQESLDCTVEYANEWLADLSTSMEAEGVDTSTATLEAKNALLTGKHPAQVYNWFVIERSKIEGLSVLMFACVPLCTAGCITSASKLFTAS